MTSEELLFWCATVAGAPLMCFLIELSWSRDMRRLERERRSLDVAELPAAMLLRRRRDRDRMK